MKKRLETIWHYTPSNTSPADLEAILIEREPILKELQEAVRLCVKGKGARHFLLVGPRGAGKTHVLSVARHRLANDPKLRPKIVLAWLPEDMFGMTKPVEWFRTLADELIRRGEIPQLEASLTELRTPEQRTAESVARLIVSFLEGRTLVILHENLNRVLRQLGHEGQQTVRAFLQNHSQIMLIATTPSISESIADHDAPFHGFFQIRNLEELTYEGSLELFLRLAGQRGDTETVEYLNTSAGKGRVRSVHALAGSNPRILVVFAAMMSKNALDRLLPVFEKTIDDLTPYYQERMESLSPQQQQVMNLFLRKGTAISPSDAAEELWLEQRTVAKVLGDLVEFGFLRRLQDGKRSWYDLREPLMKMAWQVKDARTEPLELIVDFVRVWFTPQESKEQAELVPSGSSIHRTLVKAIQLGMKLDLDPMDGADELRADLLEGWVSIPHDLRVRKCEELIAQRSKAASVEEFLFLAFAYVMAGNMQDADTLLEKFAPLASTSIHHQLLAFLYSRRKEYALSRDEANHALKLDPNAVSMWGVKAAAFEGLGETISALDAADMARKSDPNDLLALRVKYRSHQRLDESEEALIVVNRLLELCPTDRFALKSKSSILDSLGDPEGALAAIEDYLKVNSTDASAFTYQGFFLFGLGRFEESLESAEVAVNLGSTGPEPWLLKALNLGSLDRIEEALVAVENAISIAPESAQPWAMKGLLLLQLGRFDGEPEAREQLSKFDPSSHNVRLRLAAEALASSDFPTFQVLSKLGIEQANQAAKYNGGMSDLIRALLEHANNSQLRKAVQHLIRNIALPRLHLEMGKAIVEAIPDLLLEDTTEDRAEQWLQAWRSAGLGIKQYEVPLRILGAAVAYKADKSQVHLLQLPSEERSILASLLPDDTIKLKGRKPPRRS